MLKRLPSSLTHAVFYLNALISVCRAAYIHNNPELQTGTPEMIVAVLDDSGAYQKQLSTRLQRICGKSIFDGRHVKLH